MGIKLKKIKKITLNYLKFDKIIGNVRTSIKQLYLI